MDWRKNKAIQMIKYYKKRITFLEKVGGIYNRYDIIELKNNIEEYYIDFPELREVIT